MTRKVLPILAVFIGSLPGLAVDSTSLAALSSLDPSERKSAAASLGKAGDNATAIVIALANCASKDRVDFVRVSCIQAIGELRGAASATLIVLAEAMVAKDPEVRKAAITTAGKAGKDAYPILSEMSQLLADPDWQVRRLATKALADSTLLAALDELTRALKDSNRQVRQEAAESLGRYIDLKSELQAALLVTAAKDPDYRVRNAAVNALVTSRAENQDLVPVLVSLAIKDPSWEVRDSAVGALAGRKDATDTLISAARDPHRLVRSSAAKAMANLPDSKKKLDVLTALLGDASDEVRYQSALALGGVWSNARQLTGYISRDPSPEQIRQLHALVDSIPSVAKVSGQLSTVMNADPDEYVRGAAAVSLSKLTPILSAARDELRFWNFIIEMAPGEVRPDRLLAPMERHIMEALVRALRDRSEYVRQYAAKSLAGQRDLFKDVEYLIQGGQDTEIGVRTINGSVQEGDALVSALTELSTILTSDGDERVREATALALGAAVPAAASLASVLATKSVKDDKAADAIVVLQSRLTRAEASAMDSLSKALDDSAVSVRANVLSAMVEIRPQNEDIRSRIRLALAANDEDVRFLAVKAVQAMGDKQATALLIARLPDVDKDIRREAVKSLANLGEVGPDAAEAIVALLHDSDPLTRAEAIDALRRVKPTRSDYMALMISGMADTNPSVRKKVLEALRPDEERPPEILKLYGMALKDYDPEVRAAAESGMARYGLQAWPYFSELRSLLKDKNPAVSAGAAQMMGFFGARAVSAVPALTQMLSSPSDSTQRAAARSLGWIGPAASAATIPLTRLLDKESLAADVRVTLGRIGKPAEVILTPLAVSPDSQLRSKAVTALQMIKEENWEREVTVKTLQGQIIKIKVGPRAPLFGLATWCEHSAEFKAMITNTDKKPYFTGYKFAFLFTNEWPDVRVMLKEQMKDSITDAELDARIAQWKRASTGLQTVDPSFLEQLPGPVYFTVPETEVSPSTFPTVLSKSGGFDDDARGWLPMNVNYPKSVMESFAESFSRAMSKQSHRSQ